MNRNPDDKKVNSMAWRRIISIKNLFNLKKGRIAVGWIGGLIIVAVCWSRFRYKDAFDSLKHEARQIDFWDKYGFHQKPFEDRFFDIPDAVLDYLNRDNQLQGWPNRPIRAMLPPNVRAQLIEVLRELPSVVREKAKPLLKGAFFVSDLGGTAFSESILDHSGQPVAGFMVFDELILHKVANEWATWKEQSPFDLGNSHDDMRVVIEEPMNDNMKNAFQFILLHELGHIISINSGMHPPWGERISNETHPSKYAFSQLSWTIRENRNVSLFEEKFPLRPDIQFYRGGLKADLFEVYSALERTNFPTLYSATNPSDDFADSFASFVHVVLLEKPYQVKLTRNGQIVKKVDPCWGQKRCQEKERILKQLLIHSSAH